ncbi:cupin domain-containing protein [Microbacterium sp.]|uniref:cupin domain-containing protein n=1 Tax=Microbacterium sp. TaxID=51671 RepID=UPI0039E489DA
MSLFPGGVAVTDLAVYDGGSGDDCGGGSPHLHTASSEGYVVTGGAGAVQTLSAAGFDEQRLAPGDVVWFTPGTVHRLVNGGGLRLLVVMANAGLPESGDAVLTFPAAVLDDPEAYAAAARLPEDPAARERAVRARRELALAGFAELRAGGPDALAALHVRAARLVRPRVAQWQGLWERTVAAETARVGAQLEALSEGMPGLMDAASVARAEPTSPERSLGMCGRLHTWRWPAG